MHVDLTCIAQLSIVGIVQAESSCISNIPRQLIGKKNLISMHMYFASAVLTTLFQWSLTVSMSAVGTDNSQSYWIRFPPAVM